MIDTCIMYPTNFHGEVPIIQGSQGKGRGGACGGTPVQLVGQEVLQRSAEQTQKPRAGRGC